MRNAITLACTDCKPNNATIKRTRIKNNPDRIEMMK